MNNQIALSLPPKILTVDDDPDIGIALSDLLEHEGYHVQTVATGAEALNQVKSQRFDAVLLDIRLPDLDGWYVLERMNELDSNLPVILHTAQLMIDWPLSDPKSNGAFAYLSKPFNRQQLKDTLRKALASSPH